MNKLKMKKITMGKMINLTKQKSRVSLFVNNFKLNVLLNNAPLMIIDNGEVKPAKFWIGTKSTSGRLKPTTKNSKPSNAAKIAGDLKICLILTSNLPAKIDSPNPNKKILPIVFNATSTINPLEPNNASTIGIPINKTLENVPHPIQTFRFWEGIRKTLADKILNKNSPKKKRSAITIVLANSSAFSFVNGTWKLFNIAQGNAIFVNNNENESRPVSSNPFLPSITPMMM